MLFLVGISLLTHKYVSKTQLSFEPTALALPYAQRNGLCRYNRYHSSLFPFFFASRRAFRLSRLAAASASTLLTFTSPSSF